MKLHLNITGKLAFIFVLFSVALLSGLGSLAYTSGRAGLQQAAAAELLSTAFEKQSALERWFTAAQIDIQSQVASPAILEQAAALLSAAPGSPQALTAHDGLVGEFLPAVGPQTIFVDLFLIDPHSGEVLVSTNPQDEGKFKESTPYFINGRIQPYVSEVYYSTSLARPVVAAAAPVTTKDGRLLGVLAGRLDTNILNSLISQRSGLHATDDSYLVNSSGLLVTQPRFMSDPAVLQRRIKTEATMLCLAGNSGVALYDDYRGQAVIGAYRWLPAYRICLITEFDQSEAFAPSQAFSRTIALAGSLTMMCAVLLAIMIARAFTRPILALQSGVKRLGQGDLDFHVGVTSHDEVGSLAIAFNEMVVDLKKQVADREHAERMQEALYAISQTAVITENLQDFYASIHHALGNLMPTDNFYIALYDPASDLISFPYFVDQYDELSPPQKPGRGLTEYVLRTGRSLLVDQQLFAQLVQQGEVGLVGTASVDWLGVPLKVGPKIIGVMSVQSYKQDVRIGTAEKEMLEFVSTQVTTVIERKLAQQRIADALKFNNILIDSSILGISAYDASGQCILANEAIAKIVGATREQVLKQNYNYIESWKKSGLLDTAREAVTSNNSTRQEIHTTSTFGKDIWLDCRFTPFVSSGEHHLLLIIDDVSVSKQAEVDLRSYMAKLEMSNRDLQEFAYVASHDLQEPLRKVQAFSDRLATRYTDALDETGRDYLKRMRDASQRMQILITDLLSFSRISTRAQPFAEADLNTITREALSDLESRIEHAQAHVEVGQLPMLKADPTQMRQLMQNLIGNALKFRDGQRPCLIKISAKIEGETCRISVEDNGIGFDVQYLDRIFKPFQRLHNREEYEGSGMGLAICRRIVERHGGSITADSASGQGTTFLVSLPIHGSQGDQ